MCGTMNRYRQTKCGDERLLFIEYVNKCTLIP